MNRINEDISLIYFFVIMCLLEKNIFDYRNVMGYHLIVNLRAHFYWITGLSRYRAFGEILKKVGYPYTVCGYSPPVAL